MLEFKFWILGQHKSKSIDSEAGTAIFSSNKIFEEKNLFLNFDKNYLTKSDNNERNYLYHCLNLRFE